MIKVTVWNEYIHEKNEETVAKVYPKGIHGQIAEFLSADDISVRTATLDMPEHGLTDEVLDDTDVLIWWGHMAHDKVSDEVVDKVYKHVHDGMGLVVLHSGHHSKIFRKLMGTSCNLQWGAGVKERVWMCNPTHPIAKGIPQHFELEEEEMYGELFDIPKPDDIIFTGWFKNGYVMRSGCTFTRGYGKIFYFQPGHETYPIYYNEYVQQIIRNGVHWAAPQIRGEIQCPHAENLENV